MSFLKLHDFPIAYPKSTSAKIDLFSVLNILPTNFESNSFQILMFFWRFYVKPKQNIIFISVGWDVKWCPVSRITRKRFRWRVVSWGPPVKLQNFTNNHRLLIFTAVIWLKYCRYIVKPYTINQSFVDPNPSLSNLTDIVHMCEVLFNVMI